MSKIVNLENATLYKVITTTKKKNGSVTSSVEFYVYAFSPHDVMGWVTIDLKDGYCEIKIEEVDCLIDSKLFVKE